MGSATWRHGRSADAWWLRRRELSAGEAELGNQSIASGVSCN